MLHRFEHSGWNRCLLGLNLDKRQNFYEPMELFMAVGRKCVYVCQGSLTIFCSLTTQTSRYRLWPDNGFVSC